MALQYATIKKSPRLLNDAVVTTLSYIRNPGETGWLAIGSSRGVVGVEAATFTGESPPAVAGEELQS